MQFRTQTDKQLKHIKWYKTFVAWEYFVNVTVKYM